MTRRGQLTMALLVVLGFAGGWWTAQRLGALWGGAPSADGSAIAVSAAPPNGGDAGGTFAWADSDSLAALAAMP
jgi:hypothetical protein